MFQKQMRQIVPWHIRGSQNSYIENTYLKLSNPMSTKYEHKPPPPKLPVNINSMEYIYGIGDLW